MPEPGAPVAAPVATEGRPLEARIRLAVALLFALALAQRLWRLALAQWERLNSFLQARHAKDAGV